MKWVKKNLAGGSPIVTFVMCKGDDHNAYGLGPFDHIEPIFGLYSNNPLTDEEVHDDDWLVHGSDYAIDGDKNQGYFRKFSSMVDTTAMDGNCKDAIPTWKHNEMYPCFNDQQNYGASIHGLADPKNQTMKSSLTVSLINEPNVRSDEKAVEMEGWLTTYDTIPNYQYIIYRYNNKDNYPTDSDFANSKFDSKMIFKAYGTDHKHKVENILSDGEAYFAVCILKKDTQE